MDAVACLPIQGFPHNKQRLTARYSISCSPSQLANKAWISDLLFYPEIESGGAWCCKCGTRTWIMNNHNHQLFKDWH